MVGACKEFEIAGQILRSGTRCGSNGVKKPLAGISRADFVVKMSIASKEARRNSLLVAVIAVIQKSFPR